ncbi:glycosyltransferase [Escherichia coli]|uniref:glycosyltransferase n=1 Tax=Escherichia coli TaxID=562 RepID=UPI002341509C|nr:glycosyltransferase [Escherichia coli]MDC3475927.1 glycosyltransferase [Escherichia coli]
MPIIKKIFKKKIKKVSASNDIALSVICMTYNHGAYIEKALKGFIEQKTNFKFEVIIGDDCSNDDTPEIIKKYVERNPELFIFIQRSENVGPRENVNSLCKIARGRYLAFNEGDDYWTSPYKLQKQYDYMENNKSCAVCFHPVEIIDENDKDFIDIFPKNLESYKLTTNDLIKRNFIQTNSVVYRWNDIIKNKVLNYLDDVVMPGDWMRHLVISTFGEVNFIPEVMSAYRKNDGGIWGKLSDKQRKLKYGQGEIRFFESAKTLVGDSEIKLCEERIKKVFTDLFIEHLLNSDSKHLYALIDNNRHVAEDVLSTLIPKMSVHKIKSEHSLISELEQSLKVSVVVTSYNHESYLRQVFESILMQRGFFSLEIIHADDCSQDKSSTISSSFKLKHNQKIRVLHSTKNIGMLMNMKRAFQECSGDYIAICEGDDYWLSDVKILKQLAVMLKNKNYSMCFNWILLEYINNGSFIPHPQQANLNLSSINFHDIVKTPITGNFSCCFYKADVIRTIPDIYFEEKGAADWLFNVCAAKQGDIGFIREILSVYRIHNKGQWSGLDIIKQKEKIGMAKDTFRRFFPEMYPEDSSIGDVILPTKIDLSINNSMKFNIDRLMIQDYYVEISGWVFKVGENCHANDKIRILLVDSNGNVKKSAPAKIIERPDVDRYAKKTYPSYKENDYRCSGFKSTIPIEKYGEQLYIAVYIIRVSGTNDVAISTSIYNF